MATGYSSGARRMSVTNGRFYVISAGHRSAARSAVKFCVRSSLDNLANRGLPHVRMRYTCDFSPGSAAPSVFSTISGCGNYSLLTLFPGRDCILMAFFFKDVVWMAMTFPHYRKTCLEIIDFGQLFWTGVIFDSHR